MAKGRINASAPKQNDGGDIKSNALQEEKGKEIAVVLQEDHNVYERLLYRAIMVALYAKWISYFLLVTRDIKIEGEEGIGKEFEVDTNVFDESEYTDASREDYLARISIAKQMFYINLVFMASSIIMQLFKINARNIQRLHCLATLLVLSVCTNFWFSCTCILFCFTMHTVTANSHGCKSVLLVLVFSCYAITASTKFTDLVMTIKGQWSTYFSSDGYLYAWFAIQTVLMRSLSFCFEMMDNERNKEDYNLTDLYAYVFNIGRIFSSQMQNYDEYLKYIHEPIVFNGDRIWTLAQKLLKLSLIFVLVELVNTYLFTGNMLRELSILDELTEFQMFGLIVLEIHIFTLSTWLFLASGHLQCAVDGIETSSTPTTMVNVHRGQDIWRSYNIGFYEFTKKYILFTVTNFSRSVIVEYVAKALCFVFVCLQCGCEERHVVCCSIAYVSYISHQFFANYVDQMSWMKYLKLHVVGDRMQRRIRCLLYAVLHVPLVFVAVVMFVGSYEVAEIFLRKQIQNPISLVQSIGIFYVMVQCVMPTSRHVTLDYDRKKR